MGDAGWLPIAEKNRNPRQLADICLKAKYQGPFELIFYCYYAFPTVKPEHIRNIFGNNYLSEFIEPEAIREFRETIEDTPVKAVVAFNKEIFNVVSKDPVKKCIEDLKQGKLIRSEIKGIGRNPPIFLTFPTGWRFDKTYSPLRKASLDTIRAAICSGSNVLEKKNT
jgi:hypothetical protein